MAAGNTFQVNDLALVLRIENMDSLPDGGPLSIELDQRGCDIGRDTYLDWTLPDPQRFISGKHCEVRYRDGGYWLHDVSTNGTTVNDDTGRLTEPQREQNGRRTSEDDWKRRTRSSPHSHRKPPAGPAT